MKNLTSQTIEELESQFDPVILRVCRNLYPDPAQYRAELIRVCSASGPQVEPKHLLATLRQHTDALKCWQAILKLCRRSVPDARWRDLPLPDMERDIVAATLWLSAQIAAQPEATGIYLGLDTLNMNAGSGTNLEFGGTTACDLSQDEIEWVYGKLQYGEKHLIYGLFELQQFYSQPIWKPAFSFADYMLSLSYTGIIFGQAFIRISINRSLLAAWGFHEGDLFALGRKTQGRFDFICK
jgi:hypothetical protein